MSAQEMRMWLVSLGFSLEEIALVEEACVLNAARRGSTAEVQRYELLNDIIYFGADYWHKRIALAAVMKAAEERAAKLIDALGERHE